MYLCCLRQLSVLQVLQSIPLLLAAAEEYVLDSSAIEAVVTYVGQSRRQEYLFHVLITVEDAVSHHLYALHEECRLQAVLRQLLVCIVSVAVLQCAVVDGLHGAWDHDALQVAADEGLISDE